MASYTHRRNFKLSSKMLGYVLLFFSGVLICGFHSGRLGDDCSQLEFDVQTKININSADTTALILLPGIGEKLAARVVNHREDCGSERRVFQKVSDLEKVKGIGPKKAKAISEYICFE